MAAANNMSLEGGRGKWQTKEERSLDPLSLKQHEVRRRGTKLHVCCMRSTKIAAQMLRRVNQFWFHPLKRADFFFQKPTRKKTTTQALCTFMFTGQGVKYPFCEKKGIFTPPHIPLHFLFSMILFYIYI